MKRYTHAWLAMQAVKVLRSYVGKLKPPHNEDLKDFLDFINRSFPDTFVRGAWFPDNVIQDNLQGGHTWKYAVDSDQGKAELRRPPSHNLCLAKVACDLDQKVVLDIDHSALPDRCEALGQMIRDMVLIRNKVDIGDVVSFNNSQIALAFLMLAHYVCDAHVPVHCDSRPFDGPSSTIHPDLEEFWENEVKNYFEISSNEECFVTDADGYPLVKPDQAAAYSASILCQCEQLLVQTPWQGYDTNNIRWAAYLGNGNKNIWDYEVSVCLVSFFTSLAIFPKIPPRDINYDTVKIMETTPFRESVKEFSPKILADAVNSVALIWLAAWERWKLKNETPSPK